jgi:hypothetical protein
VLNSGGTVGNEIGEWRWRVRRSGFHKVYHFVWGLPGAMIGIGGSIAQIRAPNFEFRMPRGEESV